MEREAKLVDDPVAAEFINRLAQNLARNSDIKVPVTAKMIDSELVNAFALPGGFLFVNSGLFLRAETEAELAGAVAHEIAHIPARHGTRQASRGQIVNLASLPLIFMDGWPGYAVRQGAGLAHPLTFLKFSRGFEQEADSLGVPIYLQSRIRPDGIHRLSREDGGPGKEETWHAIGTLSFPSQYGRTDQIRAREYRTIPAPAAAIRCDDFRV